MPQRGYCYFFLDAIYRVLELERKAETCFQHAESTFSSNTHQSIKRRIIAKQLTMA